MVSPVPAGTYGPRVIGEEQFKREQQIKKEQRDIYGPRMTDGYDPYAKPAPAGKEEKPETPKGGDPASTGTPAGPEAANVGTPVVETPAPAGTPAQEPTSTEAQPAKVQVPAETPRIVAQEEPDPVAEAAGDDGYMTLLELRECLEKSPESYPRLLVAEFQRTPRPRKGAMLIFEEFEVAHQNRAEFLERIRLFV